MHRGWCTAVLTVILLFFTSTLASPVVLNATRHTEERVGVDPGRLEKLRKDYRGVFWDAAAEKCSIEQFNIIVESLRVITQVIFPLSGDRDDKADSSALNRFFIRPGEGGMTKHWITDNDLSIVYLRFMEAMANVEQFLTRGKRGKVPRRGNQLKFTCQEFENFACSKNVLARTVVPTIDDGLGWATVLCPQFFDILKDPVPSGAIRHIEDIGKGPPRLVASLPHLYSFEHMIIHELFHADVVSGMPRDYHIDDMKANIPGYQDGLTMYGATLTHQFAWLNTRAGSGLPYTGPNPNVARNADNFAWYYTNLYFAKVWGWKDDGRRIGIATGDADFINTTSNFEAIDPVTAEDILPATAPPACYFINTDSPETLDYFCAYKGQTEEDWLAELPYPFESYGGCELSSECHMPANMTKDVHPDCTCKCDGENTPLTDIRCDGFEGTLGGGPSSTAPPAVTTLVLSNKP